MPRAGEWSHHRVHNEDQRYWYALSAIFNAVMGCLRQWVGGVVAFITIAGGEIQGPKSKGQILSNGPYESKSGVGEHCLVMGDECSYQRRQRG
jgi:hypothetical protein